MAFFFFFRKVSFFLVRVCIIINNSRRLCLYPPWKLIYSWYPKQPFLNGCLVKQQFFMQWFGIIQWKHPFINRCFRFQVEIWWLVPMKFSFSKGPLLRGHVRFSGGTTCRAHVCTQPNSQAIPGDGGRQGSFGRGGELPSSVPFWVENSACFLGNFTLLGGSSHLVNG